MNYECSGMTLEVMLSIYLLVCLFILRTVVLGFTLGFKAIWSQVLGHPSSVWCKLHIAYWALSQIKHNCLFSQALGHHCTPLYEYIMNDRQQCRSKGVLLL